MEKLVKVQLKPGCKHRMPVLKGGLGEEYGPGTVLRVTAQEAQDFADKFDLLSEEAVESPPVDVEYVEPLATPAAFKLAEQYGVDLSKVEGTGQDGKIVLEDVKKVVDG